MARTRLLRIRVRAETHESQALDLIFNDQGSQGSVQRIQHLIRIWIRV